MLVVTTATDSSSSTIYAPLQNDGSMDGLNLHEISASLINSLRMVTRSAQNFRNINHSVNVINDVVSNSIIQNTENGYLPSYDEALGSVPSYEEASKNINFTNPYLEVTRL